MKKLDLVNITLQPRRSRGLPQVGQQIRLTACKDGEIWQGSRRFSYRSGQVYLGVVMAVAEDGLIDLRTEEGQELRLYQRDTAFEFEFPV
ncbi:MAG: hypothetical protein HGA65_01140 [Oscillochloris sp.]|nr:hypothetical protein [Oscillochloris sp.]